MVHKLWRLPAGVGLDIAAVIGATAVIIRTATVVGRAAAIVDRAAAIIIVIIGPAVLGRGNRKPGADDRSKSPGCCRTSATTVITSAGADVGGAACPRGRHRSAFA